MKKPVSFSAILMTLLTSVLYSILPSELQKRMSPSPLKRHSVEIIQSSGKRLQMLNMIFENTSQMGACVRILQVLFAVFRAIPEAKRKKVKKKCHATFTDYLRTKCHNYSYRS